MEKEIQNKIDLLIKDMGKSTFLKLLHFVVEVMESDYAIKILMSRRFLDIFLEFGEIVHYLYDGSAEIKGVFVTNLSVITLRDRLADQTILIVDDIRLHGRALDEINSFLVQECHCPKENIVLKVFADNINAVKVESRFINKIEIQEHVNENRWSKVSSSIINSFYILGQPYISYLPYCEFEFSSEEASAISKFIQTNAVDEMTTEIQNYYGVRGYIYFMDFGYDKELITKMPFVEQNMIRIYIYDKLNKIIIIPYAFLKPISSEGILSCYEFLINTIGQKIIASPIMCDAVAIEKDEYLIEYLYSMLTYVMSMVVGKKFLANREVHNVLWQREIEEYSFGCHFNFSDIELDSIIEMLSYKAKNEYVESNSVNLQLSKEIESERINTKIGKINFVKPCVYRYIESYIKLNNELDEELAKQKKQRIRGIEYFRLHRYLAEEKTKDIWKAIIKIVDSGRGTLSPSISMINQKSYLDSLLYAGEQNFACNEPNLVYFIYPLLEFECFCQNNSVLKNCSEKDMIKGKSHLIDSILKLHPELCEGIDDNEIDNLKVKSLLKGGIDYYMSRYPVYEKDDKLKQILESVRHYTEGEIHRYYCEYKDFR